MTEPTTITAAEAALMPLEWWQAHEVRDPVGDKVLRFVGLLTLDVEFLVQTASGSQNTYRYLPNDVFTVMWSTDLQAENAALRARLERVKAVLADVPPEEPPIPLRHGFHETSPTWHVEFGKYQLAQRIREALEADE